MRLGSDMTVATSAGKNKGVDVDDIDVESIESVGDLIEAVHNESED